jgi:hypothetical protein
MASPGKTPAGIRYSLRVLAALAVLLLFTGVISRLARPIPRSAEQSMQPTVYRVQVAPAAEAAASSHGSHRE